jgi:hypothetical protein
MVVREIYDKLERIWKEVVMAYSTYYLRFYLSGTENSHEKSQNSICPEQVSN